MNALGKIFFIILFFASNAWAGFGPTQVVKIPTENNLSLLSTATVTPRVVIEPSGDGQLVWARNETLADGNTTSRFYAQAISSGNALQAPVVLEERVAATASFLVLDFVTNVTGNAVLVYAILPATNPETDDWEVWTLNYDITAGWQSPAKLGIVNHTFDLQLYMTGDGSTYATVKEQRDQYLLYQYQSDASWKLLQNNVYAQQFGAGANGSFYRLYKGETDDTEQWQYLSFYNPATADWNTPLIVNKTILGDALSFSNNLLVGREGDIFAMGYKLDFLTREARLIMRKYEVESSMWEVDADEIVFSYNEGDNTPLVGRSVFINENNDTAEIMSVVVFNDKAGDYNTWKTVHYSEQNGWQTTRVLRDAKDATENRKGIAVTPLGNDIYTDGNGHALFTMCRNDCDDIYAKMFDLTNGWSDELPLPGLSADNGNGCTVAGGMLAYLSPRVAVNASGQLIAASGLSSLISGSFGAEHHIATATGDILSATSDTSCAQTTGNADSQNTLPSANGETDSSDDSQADTDSSSSGAVSWLWLMVFALIGLFTRRFFRLSNTPRHGIM